MTPAQNLQTDESVGPWRPVVYLPPELTQKHLRMWGPVAEAAGFWTHDAEEAAKTPFPLLVGATLGARQLTEERTRNGLPWIYWDRGYFARFPQIPDPFGYHRLTINAFQQNWIWPDVDSKRGKEAFRLMSSWPIEDWRPAGRDILVCAPSDTYVRYHGLESWLSETIEALDRHTDRPIRVRNKGASIPLPEDLHDVHAVVTHGSNVAVEAVLCGVPVFVDPTSAAAPVGLTDLAQIASPVRPDRVRWAMSLAYGQFTLKEMVEGVPWRLLRPKP